MPQVAAYVTNEQLNASSEVREKTLTKVDLRKESILKKEIKSQKD